MAESHLPKLRRISDDDRAATRGDSSSLHPGVRRDVGRHPVVLVDPTGTEHEGVEAEPIEGHVGQVAGHHQLPGTDVAAGSDQPNEVVVGQVDERADAERHHGDRSSPQGPPDLGGGGPGVEHDRLAVGDEGSDGDTDALLCLGSLEDPDGIGLLVGSQAGGHGQAVGPPHHALGLEEIQIPADGHFRAPQLGGQFAHRHRAASVDRLGEHAAGAPGRSSSDQSETRENGLRAGVEMGLHPCLGGRAHIDLLIVDEQRGLGIELEARQQHLVDLRVRLGDSLNARDDRSREPAHELVPSPALGVGLGLHVGEGEAGQPTVNDMAEQRHPAVDGAATISSPRSHHAQISPA